MARTGKTLPSPHPVRRFAATLARTEKLRNDVSATAICVANCASKRHEQRNILLFQYIFFKTQRVKRVQIRWNTIFFRNWYALFALLRVT
jgi:hypothetical protein